MFAWFDCIMRRPGFYEPIRITLGVSGFPLPISDPSMAFTCWWKGWQLPLALQIVLLGIFFTTRWASVYYEFSEMSVSCRECQLCLVLPFNLTGTRNVSIIKPSENYFTYLWKIFIFFKNCLLEIVIYLSRRESHCFSNENAIFLRVAMNDFLSMVNIIFILHNIKWKYIEQSKNKLK